MLRITRSTVPAFLALISLAAAAPRSARLDEAAIKGLEIEAYAGCKCEQKAGRPTEACWKAFDAQIKPFRNEGQIATACYPGPVVQELSDRRGGRASILMMTSTPAGMTCSDAETRYVMNAMAPGMAANDPAEADRAAGVALQQIRDGMVPTMEADLGAGCG